MSAEGCDPINDDALPICEKCGHDCAVHGCFCGELGADVTLSYHHASHPCLGGVCGCMYFVGVKLAGGATTPKEEQEAYARAMRGETR